MKKHRAFLKWAGGKYTLVNEIKQRLPAANCLVEPFVGAGSVFLNTNYSRYILADINRDLIHLYQIVQRDAERFIHDARTLFSSKTNNEVTFYQFRRDFNHSEDRYQRALLFLYLNRHGYNGLCRYNRLGEFNVPFGRYQRPYFPERELAYFAEKAQSATFICSHYQTIMADAPNDAVIYCDPPYAPLTPTANFTSYHSNRFNLEEQQALAKLAEQCATHHNIPVLISNHSTELTQLWYQNAELFFINVKRTISSNKLSRVKVTELLALYR